MNYMLWLRVFLAGIAGAATGVAASMLKSRKPTAEELERRRRREVSARGRTGNATILDVSGNVITYSYEVGGMEYTASQEISDFASKLPADPSTLAGRPAIFKYLEANPANSIVLAEGWNGLRFRPAAPPPDTRA